MSLPPQSNDQITVAHIVYNLDVGGLENVVVSLINRLDGSRFRSVLYCLEHEGKLIGKVEKTCAAVEALEKDPGIALRAPFQLARLMRRHHVDVAHCHNFAPFFYGAPAARLGSTARIVYTLHGPSVPSLARQRFVQRHWPVDRFVAVSDYMARDIMDVIRPDPDAVVTIRNGVDMDAFGSVDSRDEVRARLGFDDTHVVIGNVARLSPEKDHATLISAWASLAGDDARVRLVLVGDGDERKRLETQVGEAGLSDRVQFLGNRGDVARLLPAFDVFALSSRAEGLGITLIEAMAAGLPVVATRVGGIPEIVADGETGRLVDPGAPVELKDALAAVIANESHTRSMAERGRERARAELGIQNMLDSYARIYEALAGRKGNTSQV